MIVSPNVLFKHCYGDYAIAAINVFTLEQVLAVFRAAELSDSPVIIQTTPAARDYATAQSLLAMILATAKQHPDVVYALHLDHGNELHIDSALQDGRYNSVMIDASHDPFPENCKRTKAVVDAAHLQGIFVEAELGVLSGVEDDLIVDVSLSAYTQPEQAASFVQQTGCDSLAVAVGTSHGAYKFKGDQGIRFDVLAAIQHELPSFPLVLHGGSAVSAAEIERINAVGGSLLQDARGVSDQEIRRAIGFGVCKVNVATDLRVLWTRVHREFFANQPQVFDPVAPGKLYIDALTKFCMDKFQCLNSVEKAAYFRDGKQSNL
ncbi:class II fructose-bisphosphate aldolase [Sphingobacterium sp. lm-10]|uniref:class II fructose-bisphosphate aldolase n=1 Tax=Sphingobacterium sp. lm-10 TaxID=2944904 RepID=UPI00201FFB56|nr:class II fructose-bisphosphate aldolase [Sphingobacterium sp. lm-10]MCL7986364.1 class II fructose-bisphosphate aldolase [Sphingobacterium sp. lm-10]